MSESLPNQFFKYREFNDRSESIFTERKLYLPSPSSFNDPFDCRLRLKCESDNPMDYINFLQRVLINQPDFLLMLSEKYGVMYSPDLYLRRARALMARYGLRRFGQQILNDMQDDILWSFGVYCMSSCSDDMLMWSYYADGHKGFCLEISNKGIFAYAKEVFYSPGYEELNLLDFDFSESAVETLRNHVLLTKSDRWKHEQEWRVLNRAVKPGLRQLDDDEFLNGVIFGAEMTAENKDTIRSWLANGNLNVQLYQAEKKESVFGLNVVPIV